MSDLMSIPAVGMSGGLINLLIFAVLGVILLVVFGLLIYGVSKKQIFGNYPYKVRVWVRRGSNVILFEEVKARFSKDPAAKEKTQLVRKLWDTEYIQKISDEFIDADNVINVISPQKGEYHEVKPIKITESNEFVFKPQINHSAALIHSDNVKTIHDEYNRLSTIEKLMPLMTILGVGMMVFLIAWGAGTQMVEASHGMGAAANAFAQARAACGATLVPPPI
jgi:hypothetical protein